METPREINKRTAYRIIDTRLPHGLFFLKEGTGYTGIDNLTGEAWTEEFQTKEDCLKWLKEYEQHSHRNNISSPRIVQMIDGKVYDTSKAESLCDSRESCSDTLYMEMFKDISGAYFIAYFQLWEGGHNHITPINKEAARKFWERYS